MTFTSSSARTRAERAADGRGAVLAHGADDRPERGDLHRAVEARQHGVDVRARHGERRRAEVEERMAERVDADCRRRASPCRSRPSRSRRESGSCRPDRRAAAGRGRAASCARRVGACGRAVAAASACARDRDRRPASNPLDHHRRADRTQRRRQVRERRGPEDASVARRASPSGDAARRGEPAERAKTSVAVSRATSSAQRAVGDARAPRRRPPSTISRDRRDAGDRFLRERARASTTRRRPAGRRCRPGCRSCRR